MRYLFNNITLFIISFLSFCLIVIGFLLHAILIPIQDFHTLSETELLEFQKEYALNYPLGQGLFNLGIFLMISVIILFIMKFINKRNSTQNRTYNSSDLMK